MNRFNELQCTCWKFGKPFRKRADFLNQYPRAGFSNNHSNFSHYVGETARIHVLVPFSFNIHLVRPWFHSCGHSADSCWLFAAPDFVTLKICLLYIHSSLFIRSTNILSKAWDQYTFHILQRCSLQNLHQRELS